MSAEKPPAAGARASSGPAEPEPPPEGEGDRTPLERAAEAAEELYRLRDTFFPRDPAEKTAALRARADAALALLDALPPGTPTPPFPLLATDSVRIYSHYHTTDRVSSERRGQWVFSS
jgi:hypothetical protein